MRLFWCCTISNTFCCSAQATKWEKKHTTILLLSYASIHTTQTSSPPSPASITTAAKITSSALFIDSARFNYIYCNLMLGIDWNTLRNVIYRYTVFMRDCIYMCSVSLKHLGEYWVYSLWPVWVISFHPYSSKPNKSSVFFLQFPNIVTVCDARARQKCTQRGIGYIWAQSGAISAISKQDGCVVEKWKIEMKSKRGFDFIQCKCYI